VGHARRDARGELVTAASRDVVDLYDAAVGAYLGARANSRRRAQFAVEADPDFALAHCLDGYLAMLSSTRDGARQAEAALARGRDAARRRPTTAREARHLDALDAWVRGDLRAATERWSALLVEHPRDIVAIKVSQFILSYLGESTRMRDLIAAVIPAWDAAVPGYGFLLGCYAYALEEAGAYAAADELGRRAVAIDPSDIWAAHAVAHVAEMEGRLNDGLAWIASTAGAWRECNNFARHLRWHEGLYHLDLERHDHVLALYDREVCNPESDEYLDMANAASLLWRLEQAGVDVGTRWRDLVEHARRHRDDHALVFVDLHYLMALAGGSDAAEVEQFMDSCERFALTASGSEAGVMADVGMPLARAVWAHRRGRYDDVVAELAPVRAEIRRVGGSHAQRDVFEQMLIDAAWRGRHYGLAADLLAERTSCRPRNIWGWKHYAAVLAATGAGRAAEAAHTFDRLREQ
jgi:tetratricopeptide (TPR) repeat protein